MYLKYKAPTSPSDHEETCCYKGSHGERNCVRTGKLFFCHTALNKLSIRCQKKCLTDQSSEITQKEEVWCKGSTVMSLLQILGNHLLSGSWQNIWIMPLTKQRQHRLRTWQINIQSKQGTAFQESCLETQVGKRCNPSARALSFQRWKCVITLL